jgi:hypothetical protein
MTRTLLISAALLACACGRDSQRPQANPEPSASTPSAQSAVPPQPTATTGTDHNSIVLVGCLQGDGRFALTNATAESPASGAAPAIAAGSTITLDSMPPDARSHVNKQVRVTGHFGAARPDAGARTASPSGGSTSTRDDVRANSTTVAGNTPEPPRDGRLIVDGVTVIAESCATR